MLVIVTSVSLLVWSVRGYQLSACVKTALTAGSAVAGLVLLLAVPINETAPSSPAPSTAASRPPGGTASPPALAPTFTGTFAAKNRTIDQEDIDGKIEAAPQDDLFLTLRLTNQASTTASGVLLQVRVRTPPEKTRRRVIDFTVQHGGDGPEALVEGESRPRDAGWRQL